MKYVVTTPKKKPDINNFVAKHASKFNKASVIPDKLKTYVRKPKHVKKLGL